MSKITIVSLIWYLLFLNGLNGKNRRSPVVSTNLGEVEGTVDESFFGKEYFSYRGIPFAEPPTENFRFKPSVAKEPWDGILDGSQNGASCMQLNSNLKVVGSEDCLFLNVYSPQLFDQQKELLPVLVFIHGGSWQGGSASDKSYSPIYLMDRDIVVVAIQYRVGALGFLSTNDGEAPGNYGLHDQVRALEWIQSNIAAFGGDPSKVTISGQSAGAASAHMHLFSPLSQGLFRSVISFSGSAINFWANRIDEEQLSYAQKLADAVGCPLEGSKELISCLKTVSAEELTLVQPSLHDIFQGTSAKLPITTFSPRADKEAARPFLPKSALEMARQGQMPSYPFLTGYASQEGAFKTASLFGQDSMAFLKEFDANPLEALKALTGNQFSHESDLSKIFSFYLNNQLVANQSQRIAMTELLSDNRYNFEGFMSAYFHARASSAPVFLFKFDFRGLWSYAHEFEETEHDYEGVAHKDDMRYLLKLSAGPELSDEEIEVMKRFTGYIANFVKYSEPTVDGEWKEYRKGHGQYMIIDVPERSGMSHFIPFETVGRPGRMEFWRSMYGYPENLAEDYILP